MSAYAADYLSIDDRGGDWLEIVSPSSPAVATGFSRTMEGQYVTRPIGVHFTFTTDATVANRSVRVEYDDGNGLVFYSEASGAVVQASTTARVRHNVRRASADWDLNNFVFAPLEPLQLFGGQKLQINITNVQAGDQLSAIVLLVCRRLSSELVHEGESGAQ